MLHYLKKLSNLSMSFDLFSNWNIIDRLIYAVESAWKSLLEGISSSSLKEPDAETMIAVETDYLRRENENLKKREIPLYLIEEERHIICPKCKAQLSDPDIKYCAGCGQRVIRHIAADRYKVKNE